MKATHYGECQVCGRRQKLPGGTLSKHGYTVQCGFFDGECFGTGHLPLEQDKSLVDQAIALAQERLAGMRAYILRRMNATDPGDVVNECYESDWHRKGMHRGRGYRYLKGRVEEAGPHHFVFIVPESTTPSGYVLHREYRVSLRWAGMGSTLAEVVGFLNSQEAERTKRDIPNVENYIKWQQRRIRDWKPKALEPVEQIANA